MVLLIKIILSIFLLFLVIIPIITFIHELGHAIPALLFTKEKVLIRLGKRKNTKASKNLKISRLTIEFSSFSPITGFTFWDDSKMNINQLLITYLGGPLISLLLALLFYFLSNNATFFSQSFMAFVGNWFLFQFAITAIPMYYPSFMGDYKGVESDGMRILHLFKS